MSDILEQFEQMAKAFYLETGYMAPGKDTPAAMVSSEYEDERRIAWDVWTKQHAIIAALRLENEEQARLLGASGSREAALLARVDALEAKVSDQQRRTDALEEALLIFASEDAWKLNGICDPNSGAFHGLRIAKEALLATDDRREDEL